MLSACISHVTFEQTGWFSWNFVWRSCQWRSPWCNTFKFLP